MHPENVSESVRAKPSEQARWRSWLLVGLLLWVAGLSSITSVDRYAEREYEALFQRAFVTFALARTLNGLISAVQGTELALQPAGVGVTLTPGEILDPVNDLVERFSWIMLGATISLGIQQVLLDVGQWWGVRVAVALLGLGWLFVRLRRPVAIIANEGLYELFLEGRYVESAAVIESAGEQLERSVEQAGGTDASGGEELGWLDSLGRSLSGTREALDFNQQLERIQARAAEVIEHLIQLSVVFVLQTGILPIAFLWIFLQLLKQLFRIKN
jgi:hypothetical protein